MGVEPDVGSVTLVRWPQQDDLRRRLQQFARPRLLVIDPGTPVPTVVDRLEDWAFAGAGSEELRLRAEALAARAQLPSADRPYFDDSNLLRFNAKWAALSPAEERVARLLLARFEECVTRDELASDHDGPGPGSLNSTIKRLRRRVTPLGLAVNTVHGRGYVLARSCFSPPTLRLPVEPNRKEDP